MSDVYVRLREFLDQLPGGYPATDSGAELKILKMWYTPEEAELTMKLRMFPEPPAVIAERWGMPEAEAAEQLAQMAKKGLFTLVKGGGQIFYQTQQFLPGLWEFHVDTVDREFSELVPEMEPLLHSTLAAQIRVVPIDAAIKNISQVANYDYVKRLVAKHKVAAVMPCVCRQAHGLRGQECTKPLESCLTLGVGAEHFIATGKARQIPIAEVLERLDDADKNGMVLGITNAKSIINICMCCKCCCSFLTGLAVHERPVDIVNSNWQAKIDPALCKACKKCSKRCQVDALLTEGESTEVDLARCIGCGLCISTCSQKAISLIPRQHAPSIPANFLHMQTRLSKKRGLGFGNLNPLTKVTPIPLLLRMLPLMYKSGLGKPLVNQMAKRGWV